MAVNFPIRKEIERRESITSRGTNVFYCSSSGSDQEGACEANHELIRLILSKGSSFDDFTERCISDDESYQILIKEKAEQPRPIRNVQLLLQRRCAQEIRMFTGCSENIILNPKLLKK